MKKKITGVVLSTLLFAQWSPTQAQQAGKMFRIGYLDVTTASGSAVLVDALRQELSKLGWIEGKNITIEYRFAEEKEERLRELAAELVALKVDVLVVPGGEPALVAKKESSTTPIVMTGASDPIFLGLIASLARPGSNVTGLSSRAYELNTKRLEVLKDAFPKLGRVGFLQSTQGSTKAKDFELRELRTAASSLKVNVEAIEIETNPKALESAFQAAKQKHVEAMMTAASRYFSPKQSESLSLPIEAGCQLLIIRRHMSIKAVSCRMESTMLTSTAVRLVTWIRFSKAPNLETCLSSRRQSLNSSLTSKRQKNSV
jgi:putative ABC transport system substrate-binding protein